MREIFEDIGGLFKSIWEMPALLFIILAVVVVAAIANGMEKK